MQLNLMKTYFKMTVNKNLCIEFGITGSQIKKRMEKNKGSFTKHGILKNYWREIAMQELLKEKTKANPHDAIKSYEDLF